MSRAMKPERKKITAYQLFGWAPLLVTGLGASIVVLLSVMSQR
jgi:hypothetical protein